MSDIVLSEYQKNIIDTFKNTKDNLFIEALAGCVDCDTEYFNGTEWVRIADYKQGDKVLQYNIDTKEATLAYPEYYHKYPCEQLWHFEDINNNIDQVLCDEHNILICNGKKIQVKEWLKNRKIIVLPSCFYYSDSDKFQNVDIQYYIDKNINCNPYKTKDGYKYCFTMPLGTLILRRNNKIFITGNSGKTFILVELSKLVNSYSVFVAFNKSIQEELKDRILNPKFKTYTFNGLGYMIMNYNWSLQEETNSLQNLNYKKKSLTLDTYKMSNIISNHFKELKLNDELDPDTYFEVLESTIHLYDLCRQRLVDLNNEDEIRDVIDFYELYDGYIPSNLSEILTYAMSEDLRIFKEEGIIDFIDQIFITYFMLKQNLWKLEYYHRFENIFIDEAQDLSRLQQLFIGLLRRSKNSRYVFVGDKHQCQTKGTKILMSDGSEKNIEDVNVGDSVAQYSTQHGLILGVTDKPDARKTYIVSDKQKFNVHDLVSITLDNDYHTEYTYNHIAYVRMSEKNTKNAVCLYLMYREQDQLFRIGKVKLYSKSMTSFCLRHRMLEEGFDKAWILNIYETNKQAWINEQLYSLKYQIPQVIFQSNKTSYNLDDIKYIYNNIGGDMFNRGLLLLQEFHKDFNFPFFERGNKYNHIAKTHGFFIAACNIFPKYMEMGIYNKDNIKWHTYKNRNPTFRGRYIEYHTIKERIFKHGDYEVYGITTPYCNTYIGDKIVTHNSIYSFAGADCHSTDTIKRLYNTKILELPINYRCPTKHLDYVNRVYDIPIQSAPDAKRGTIVNIEYEDICDYIQPDDCILSRRNKDLCAIALMLLDNDFSIYIRDENLVNRLIKKISSFKKQVKDLEELSKALTEITDEYERQLAEQNQQLLNDEEVQLTEISGYSDNSIDLLECVEVLLNRYVEENQGNKTRLKSIDSFINYVKQRLCTKKTKGAIQCVSIHQAKGKEYNRVFILNENRIFYELGRTNDQRQQEENLAYIAMTRSKDTIFLVSPPIQEQDNEDMEDLFY